MKADPNKIISHQVAEKEVQQCRECGAIVDIIQAEGNNFQTSFPASVAINMHSPNTRTFPSQLSLPPRSLRGPSVLSTARAIPPDFPHGLLKTHKNGREGAGSGVQTPPG